jgi:hypothetical protein
METPPPGLGGIWGPSVRLSFILRKFYGFIYELVVENLSFRYHRDQTGHRNIRLMSNGGGIINSWRQRLRQNNAYALYQWFNSACLSW